MTVKVIVLSVLLAAGCSAAANDTTGAGAAQVMLKPLVKKLSDRIALSLLEYRDTLAYPRSTKPDGKWKTVPVRDWTSGFFPGILWSMSELAADTSFRLPAARWTEGLTPIQFYTGSHDIGFITFCSFGNGFRLTGNEAYKKVILQSAQTLTTRYNPTIGCIKSWDHTAWPYPVIIDNMMNLELLFWASKNGGTQHMYDIAIRHAEKTMLHHFRPDGSTYHVVGYDTTNGDVISRGTHQGYADESTWSRGQAWAIYGFTMAYRYTHDERFLQTAQKAAEYFLLHLPADKVPYWDFNAPNIPNEPRDASAAAIASSALFELSTCGRDQAMREKYYAGAVSILRSLSSPPYFTDTSRSLGLLNHAVGNKPANQEVDVSLIYGDYYFLEALMRYQRSKSPGGGLLGGRAKPMPRGESAPVPAEVRTSQLINDDWLYLEDAVQRVDQLGASARQWEKINLPHTWNATDALDLEPGYRRSAGWYKKELFIPQSDDGTIIRLHFEGVNMKCEVYANGKSAGTHRGGFVGFDIDLTPFVTKGAKNLIEVKADNSYDPFLIPSQKSDFVLYGGITRNVRLNMLPRTHIEKMLIQTPIVTAKTASVNAQFIAACENAKSCVIECAVKDKEGTIVARHIAKISAEHGTETIAMKLPDVANPKLWSPSSPYLYTVEARILKNGVVVDKISDRIGFRWYEFKEHGAFYLNGERLLLKGTHRHEELSGWGNALPDSIHRSDMRMIKDMGANFVRLAHYPQAPEVYRACDELGLLVWDENPWCRGGMGPQRWRESTKNIFTEMILQNYNHPSIILWSIGNESDWLPDFPGGDNKDSLRSFAKELNALAKALDPYRSTTARKFAAAEKIVDVFSPSIWSGWYSDVYKNYEKALLKARDAYPRMLHAEYGGDSHVGRHTEHPISGEGKVTTTGGDEPVNKFKSSSIANIGDWSETYIVDLFDWYLHVSEHLDWFTGSAQWIFRDFTTPLRPENPIPYVNQKGLVDMNNNPKDAYYVFKSYWTTSPKFNYIESHTWTERHGAVNEKKDVKVFSNCGEVELFVNGASLGRIKKDIAQYPASGLHWQAVFAEGRNMLRAVGYDDGKQSVVDSMNVFYSTQPVDKPDDFVLQQEKLSNGDRLITVYAVDKAGNHCTELNTRVYFSALSGGSLLSDRGTPIGSSVIELANGRARIVFKPIPSQKAVIEVRSQEMKGTYLTIDD